MAAEAPDAELHPIDAGAQSLSHDELENILALNLLWTDGTTLAGSRLNRTLWMLERSHVRPCPSAPTTTPPPEEADDHATVFASERITDEDWTEVPNGSVFSTDADATLSLAPLDA